MRDSHDFFEAKNQLPAGHLQNQSRRNLTVRAAGDRFDSAPPRETTMPLLPDIAPALGPAATSCGEDVPSGAAGTMTPTVDRRRSIPKISPTEIDRRGMGKNSARERSYAELRA